MPESRFSIRRYSLALIAGIALAAAALPNDVWQGSGLLRTPVHAPMAMSGSLSNSPMESDTHRFQIHLHAPGQEYRQTDATQFLIIDGNRNGRLVAFPHQFHQDTLEGESSCVLCHHQALPFDQNTSCAECHRDMYLPTDIFNHSVHIARLNGNSGCIECHIDSTRARTRQSSRPCKECHQGMSPAGSIVALKKETAGHASSYMEAMHGLCINCHRQKLADEPDKYPSSFAECGTCHRDLNGRQFRLMSPYVTHTNNIALEQKSTGAANFGTDYEN